MADDFSISYSYQASTPEPAPAPPPGDATLYAAAGLERVELHNGGTLLLDRHSDSRLVVAPEVSLALRSCESFRTLAGHADHLAATIPELAGQQQEVVGVLEMVRDAGLLQSADAVCKRLCPEQIPAPELAPSRVFIITCDRPEAVERLLHSMRTADLARHEQLVLVDDSRDAGNAATNRAAVQRFNRGSPLAMQYFGVEAQSRLLERLLAELPGQEPGIRFLIDRQRWAGEKSYGLARTLCLLLSVGRRALVMDDDVLCQAMLAPHAAEGLLFGDRGREVEFYASEEEALARTTRAGFDPLAGHARCLGMTLAQAIRELGFDGLGPEELQGANTAYLDLWDGDSPVLVTQSGSLGDPGTPDNDWLYTLDTSSARRLMAAPGMLEAARLNRHYWRGQPRPSFGKLAVISQVTGLDNSRLLPPYFPVYRGEDHLFGAMVEYLHPRAAVLDYPWCVPHFPLDGRPGHSDHAPADGRASVRPGKIVTDRTNYRSGITAETRLQGLAQFILELAQTSDQGLLTLYRAEAAEARAGKAARLEAILRDGLVRPAPWSSWLQGSLANYKQAVASSIALTHQPGIPAGMDDRAVLDAFRTQAGAYASALFAWPDIRLAAGRILDSMLANGETAP